MGYLKITVSLAFQRQVLQVIVGFVGILGMYAKYRNVFILGVFYFVMYVVGTIMVAFCFTFKRCLH